MVLAEIKKEKIQLMFLGLFTVIAILVFQQTVISNQINRNQDIGIQYLKHNFNQSTTNFDGILQALNTTKENHKDHIKELYNQNILLNQSDYENKILESINKTLNNMDDKNQTLIH